MYLLLLPPLSWTQPFTGPRIFASFDTVQAIEKVTNARTVIGEVTKRPEPLFNATKPWEPRIDNGYPNVLYDPERQPPFRLWYDCCIKVAQTSVCRDSDTKALLYAESDDGLAWVKPALGRVNFRGSIENNIVMECAPRAPL